MLRQLASLCLVAAVAAGPLVADDAIPSGIYHGSKSVLGEKIQATLSFLSSSSAELAITGAITLKCTEAYTYGGGKIVLTNIGTSGDCVHDVLSKEHASLDKVTYDAAADQVHVTVKYEHFVTINFVLDKAAAGAARVEAWATRHALPDLMTRYYDVFSTQQPDGLYTATRNGATIQATVSADTMDVTVDGVTRCAAADYRRDGDVLVAEACGDVLSAVRYDALSDSLTVVTSAADYPRQSAVELVRPTTAVDSHLGSDMDRLFARYYHAFSLQDPAGTYSGSKTVLGEKVSATVVVDNSTYIDLTISGVISLHCTEEYSYSSGSINLPNDGKSGDCVHDALKKNNVKLESIKYDTGADEVKVTVKYSFFNIEIDLKHQS